MRRLLLSALLLAGCASSPKPEPEPAPISTPSPQLEKVRDEAEAGLTEVRSIRAAAEDAAAALGADDARWEQARLAVPTPFQREYLEDQLAKHAKAHRLELSQFRLEPMTMAQLDFPARIHPASPYPVRPQDAILEVPVRFALTPLVPERIEAFLRTLPELPMLFAPDELKRGMDFVEVRGHTFTFRPIDPVPTYALEMPDLQQRLQAAGITEPLSSLESGPDAAEVKELEAKWGEIQAEIVPTNETLARLSELRLRRARIDAYEARREAAKTEAATIQLPPPAKAR